MGLKRGKEDADDAESNMQIGVSIESGGRIGQRRQRRVAEGDPMRN